MFVPKNEFTLINNVKNDVLLNVKALGQRIHFQFNPNKLLLVLVLLVFAKLVAATPREAIVNDVEWHKYYCADAKVVCASGKTWDDFTEEHNVNFHYNNPILKLLGTYAFTFGNDVYFAEEKVPMRIRMHEYRHVQQFERDGVFVFVVKYFYEYFSNLLSGMSENDAYENISYELDAQSAEDYTRPDQELAR